jgi:hypothetical protein
MKTVFLLLSSFAAALSLLNLLATISSFSEEKHLWLLVKLPMEEPVIKQVSKEEQSVVELSEQLGDAAMVIIAFLPFHDVLNLILVSKHWQLSMLASRKRQY